MKNIIIFSQIFSVLLFSSLSVLASDESKLNVKIPHVNQLLPNQKAFFVFSNPTRRTISVSVEGETSIIKKIDSENFESTKNVILKPNESIRVEGKAPKEFGLHRNIVVSIDESSYVWKISTIAN